MQWPKQYLIHFYTVLVFFFLGIVLPGGSGESLLFAGVEVKYSIVHFDPT